MAIPGLARRRGAVGPALLLGSGLLILSGCSGTPLGEQLSRSFPTPAAPSGGTSATGGNAAAPAAPGAAAAPTNPIPTSPQPPQAAAGPAAAGASAATGPGTTAGPTRGAAAGGAPAALPPATYRVVLKLPAADPAAPAELVTQALRAAGVRFEVETIERLGDSAAPNDSAAPTGNAPPTDTRPPR